jgi:hypothetical protein
MIPATKHAIKTPYIILSRQAAFIGGSNQTHMEQEQKTVRFHLMFVNGLIVLACLASTIGIPFIPCSIAINYMLHMCRKVVGETYSLLYVCNSVLKVSGDGVLHLAEPCFEHCPSSNVSKENDVWETGSVSVVR